MRTKRSFLSLLSLLALVVMAQSTWAKDDLSVEAFAEGAVVTPNGQAVGTIHVNYTVVGYAFTPGFFKTITLDLAAKAGGGGATTYPFPLTLVQKQQGASNLGLVAVPASHNVTGLGDIGTSEVTVTIPADASNEDGTTLVGTLEFEAPTGKDNPNFGTVTTLVVKATLVHPLSCLRLVGFLTDGTDLLESVTVKLTKPTKAKPDSTVNGTVPGQVFDNLLLVNLCGEDRVLDLHAALDPAFDTNPSGNPGNAVSTYLAAGVVDTPAGNITALFGPGTGRGQQLCLAGLTVPANQTMLVVVHSDIRKGELPGTLPADSTFRFTSTAYQAGSAGCTAGTLHPDAVPNPEEVTLPFTTQEN